MHKFCCFDQGRVVNLCIDLDPSSGVASFMEQKIVSEYFKRSYFAVDGLWFMMIEEEFSFDKALEIDENVWRILPKIQARKVKELLGLEGVGLADFLRAIEVKLEAEEYDYETKEQGTKHVQIVIRECPWYTILRNANREHLAHRIADAICSLEFRVWLKEFGEQLDFEVESRLCTGDPVCLLNFRAK